MKKKSATSKRVGEAADKKRLFVDVKEKDDEQITEEIVFDFDNNHTEKIITDSSEDEYETPLVIKEPLGMIETT